MIEYTPKTREEYIAKCLFYNGNDDFESYDHRVRIIAVRECWWVDAHYDTHMLNSLRKNLKEYKKLGLGHFQSQDGIPITLKTMYWLLWCKEVEGMGTIEDFKNAYHNLIRKYYISKCRYYNGENDNPDNAGPDSMFIDYERGWVEDCVQHNKVIKEDVMHDWLEKGDAEWLQTFSPNDGVPLSLKALLYNRYMHWCGGYNPIEIEREHFREWWNKEYLKLE